jgi:hypothetical protein
MAIRINKISRSSCDESIQLCGIEDAGLIRFAGNDVVISLAAR